MRSSLRIGFLFLALVGCRGIQIGQPEISSASASSKDPAPPAEPTREADDGKPKEPAGSFVNVNDLQARATAAQEKLASDPTGAAKELAAVREELLARWIQLESTQPQPNDGRHVRPTTPFFSDTLTKDAKDLLASTHALRAGLWADQGKADDALREMITTMGGVDSIPCPTKNKVAVEACQRARLAITTKYKGFCFDNGSSTCSASLGDDHYTSEPDPKRATLFARAWVKKVVPTKGGGFDVLTGDVPATDLEVCKGEFQTDKILDVNEKRILIERTTWCKEMAKQRRTGWRIIHHVGSGLPIAIKPGDHIVVVSDASKLKRTKTAEMITASASSTVLAIERGRSIYRWNEVTP